MAFHASSTNWANPGAIGSGTAAAGTFSSLIVTPNGILNTLTMSGAAAATLTILSSSLSTIKAAGPSSTVQCVVQADGSFGYIGTITNQSCFIQVNGMNYFEMDVNGNFTPQATAGTTMTNGFVYIPAAAGAPTGVPTSKTGHLPMYYDSTGNNFYIYNGAWKKVALA